MVLVEAGGGLTQGQAQAPGPPTPSGLEEKAGGAPPVALSVVPRRFAGRGRRRER